MAKPAITKRAVKGSALSYAELDTNFQNLADATITVTGDSGSAQVLDLNDTINVAGGVGLTSVMTTDTVTINLDNTTVTAGSYTTANITVDAQGRITAASSGSSGSGTVNSGAANAVAFYPSAGTTVDDTDLLTIESTGIIVGNNSTSATIRGNTSNTNGLSLIGGSTGNDAVVAIRRSVSNSAAGITLQCSLVYGGDINMTANNVYIGTPTNSGANTISTLSSSNDKLLLKTFNNSNIELDPAGTGLVRVSSDLDITTGVLGTSTTDTDIYIEPNGTGRVVLAKQMSTEVPAGTAFLDNSGNATSYANNATVDFANFSGMIVVNRQDTNGNVALWILGSGNVLKLGDSSGSAVSGTFAHVSGIDGYRWTNNTGGSVTVAFAAVKTRDGA